MARRYRIEPLYQGTGHYNADMTDDSPDKAAKAGKPAKKKRPGIRQRIDDGVRTVAEIGDDLAHRPAVLPGKAHGWFRTWFGRLWRVRGGGLYALGWVVTFLILEVRAIVSDIAEAESVAAFLGAELIEFFFRFMGESIINFGLAFAWPAFVIQWHQTAGLIALALAWFAFPRFLKPWLERWLFGDAPP